MKVHIPQDLKAGDYWLSPIPVGATSAAPPPAPAPAPTGGVLDTFYSLQARATEQVAWRWVMDNGATPQEIATKQRVRGALMEKLTPNGYANRLREVGDNAGDGVRFVGGMAYWPNPSWLGPPPTNVIEPGYLHVPIYI